MRPLKYLPRSVPRPDAAKTGRHIRLNRDDQECRSRDGANLNSEKQESDQPRGGDHLGSEVAFLRSKKQFASGLGWLTPTTQEQAL